MPLLARPHVRYWIAQTLFIPFINTWPGGIPSLNVPLWCSAACSPEIEDRVPADVRAQLTFEGHKLKVLGPYAMSTGTGIVAVGVGVDPTYGTLRRAAYPQNPVTLGLCSRGQPRGPLSDIP
jgi:hypothetical protein